MALYSWFCCWAPKEVLSPAKVSPPSPLSSPLFLSGSTLGWELLTLDWALILWPILFSAYCLTVSSQDILAFRPSPLYAIYIGKWNPGSSYNFCKPIHLMAWLTVKASYARHNQACQVSWLLAQVMLPSSNCSRLFQSIFKGAIPIIFTHWWGSHSSQHHREENWASNSKSLVCILSLWLLKIKIGWNKQFPSMSPSGTSLKWIRI